MADPIPGHEPYTGRVAIINRAYDGHVVGMKFRAIDEDHPVKYLGIEGLPNRLFNLHALSQGGTRIVLTEGELDAITVQTLGFHTVGVPSVSAWHDWHWRLFEGYEEVVLVRDNDGPGGDLVKRVTKTDLPVRVVSPPEGKDATECVALGYGEALCSAIRGELA